ncbi:MAG: Beta-catenin-like protein 1 [Marteilia pararefringens]
MFESNHQLEKKATLTNGSTNAEQQLQQDDECLRNLVRHCELKYNANLEARVKFQSEPLRFMSSELELFSALADFSATISRCSSEEDDEDEDKLQQNVFATLASHSSQQLLQILCGLEHDNLGISTLRS